MPRLRAAGAEAGLSTPPTSEQWVWLARIRRPQGRKGEVFADILTDFPEKFSERRQLWLLPHDGTAGAGNASPREVELAAHWLHKGGIVLHFAGVDSISTAETLAGLIVAVPYYQRAALAEDEVLIGDLIGCTVFEVTNSEPVIVGQIENVDRAAGPVPLLIVQGVKGEVLIPFAKSFLRKLDLEERRLEMTLPEGLLDLNP
jgi:16S rRNA processing protein RimM